MEQQRFLIDNNALPRVGNIAFSEIDWEQLSICRGCPVNRNTPTKLTRESFRRLCLAHQKKLENGSRMSLGGFKSKNVICVECNIGKRVKNGWNLQKVPFGITIVEFEGHKEAPQGCKKLKQIEVLKMRALYESGTTIKDLCAKFKRKRGTVADVVHHRTWKHI